MQPGRICPIHYRYPASIFNRPAEIVTDTLYVIGGLYGNRPALAAIQSLAARETSPATLVFNGDFNWFNSDAASFAHINRLVLTHVALRGNVETEMAGDDRSAGCGCAYPDLVSDAEVARSNRILDELREASRAFPELRRKLGALPMHAVAQVGDLRVGIVHGDAESLAGWQFDVASLDAPDSKEAIAAMFDNARVDVFAGSHTCRPAARKFSRYGVEKWVINNGAAGMPNFRGTRYGVITRISLRAAPPGLSQYGARLRGIFMDAIPVHYDHDRWLAEFLANWPAGSPAHASYFHRIIQGPDYAIERAAPPLTTSP